MNDSDNDFQTAMDALYEGGPLPAGTRQWLINALEGIARGEDPRAALDIGRPGALRDALIRRHAHELPEWSTSGRARRLAAEARRLHRGRQTAYPWLQRADQLRSLPESVRQYHHILQ